MGRVLIVTAITKLEYYFYASIQIGDTVPPLKVIVVEMHKQKLVNSMTKNNLSVGYSCGQS